MAKKKSVKQQEANSAAAQALSRKRARSESNETSSDGDGHGREQKTGSPVTSGSPPAVESGASSKKKRKMKGALKYLKIEKAYS